MNARVLSILIPMSRESVDREALVSARKLFTPSQTILTLLRVTPRNEPEAPSAEKLENWNELMRTLAKHPDPAHHPVYGHRLWSAFKRELTVKLEPDLQALRDSSFAVSLALRYGNPAEEIVRHAEAAGSDLIVMSTHARRGVGRVLEGSVAETVLRRAPVPVIMVRQIAKERRS